MPAKAEYYVPTPDPLSSRQDARHPLMWWYMGKPMGWLTRDALRLREGRYASNVKARRGLPESEQSAFIDHG